MAANLVPPAPRLLPLMWDKTESTVRTTWAGVAEGWRDWFAVKLDDCAAYANLQGYIEVRNAIVHGLGTLTRRQLRKKDGQATRDRIKKAGVAVVERRVELSPANIEGCAITSVEFIEWLDLQAQAAEPT